MVLMVLFWILLILLVIGVFVPDGGSPVVINRARWAIVLILIGILGWAVFGGVERPRRAEIPHASSITG